MSLENSSSVARRLTGFAGLVALSLFVANASAADLTAHKTVRYTDLNLAKSSDAARLYQRLENAAEAVCGDYELRDLSMRQVKRECEADALSKAVAEVNHPAVTALHDADARVRVAQRRTNMEPRT